jgi:hypothetical protein
LDTPQVFELSYLGYLNVMASMRFAQLLNLSRFVNSSHNSCPKSFISVVFGCIYLHNATYNGR